MRCAPWLVLVLVLPVVAADHPGTNQRGPPGPASPYTIHRNADIGDRFALWETEFPGFVERDTLGTSVAGQPIHLVKITDERVQGNHLLVGRKDKVYLDGGHHGNEYLATEIVLYYLEGLLRAAADNETTATRFLQVTEIYAAPLINPEGNALDTRKNGRLVDLNRNYPFQWGGEGAGGSVLDFTYRGPSALSEPEAAANAEFGRRLRPDLWITMHTGVAEFYWPWGYTTKKSPDDEFFRSLEEPFEEATGNRIDAKQSSELYLASGATDDWAYGELGIPTFTYEVHEDQFLPAYGEPIPEILVAQIDGLRFMVENVARMGGRPQAFHMGGPDGAHLVEISNVGLGTAWDVAVLAGSDSILVGDLAPGEVTTVEVAVDFPGVALAYRSLRIESAPTRTTPVVPLGHTVPAPDMSGIPGVGAWMLLAMLGAFVGLRRRSP